MSDQDAERSATAGYSMSLLNEFLMYLIDVEGSTRFGQYVSGCFPNGQ